MARNYRQGVYKPKNPSKYKGDPTNIVYRSSWERVVFNYLDTTPYCTQWSSEEMFIPYESPVDGKIHRYFVDIICVMQVGDKKKTMMIEIKPFIQTLPPKTTKGKSRKTLLEETATYAVNQAKWNAAEEYCQKRGIEFQIFTENEIFGRK